MSLLTLLGVSTAYGASSAPAPTSGGSPFGLFIMIAIAIGAFFLMMRPQMKRAKEHRALVSSLAAGDEVVTAGGILAKVAKLHDNFVVLTVGKDTEIVLQRNSISQVVPKGTIESIQ